MEEQYITFMLYQYAHLKNVVSTTLQLIYSTRENKEGAICL